MKPSKEQIINIVRFIKEGTISKKEGCDALLCLFGALPPVPSKDDFYKTFPWVDRNTQDKIYDYLIYNIDLK